MELSQLLSKLGNKLDLLDLGLDKNNICMIQFEGGHQISIEPEYQNRFCHLYSVIGYIPEINKLEFYECLFSKNLFGKDTERAFINCDIKQREVLLCQTFDSLSMDGEIFINMVEKFVKQVVYYTEWIKNYNLYQGQSNINEDDKPYILTSFQSHIRV